MIRLAATSVLVLSGAGLAVAGPAQGDPSPLGTYTFEGEDGQSATWTLTPCADAGDNCVQVAETGNSKRAPWTGTAFITVGSWIMFVNQPDAILCDDGSSVPGVNNYSWNSDNLSGYASINTAGACGKGPESLAIPFQLTRNGDAILYPDAPIYDAPPIPPEAKPPAAPSSRNSRISHQRERTMPIYCRTSGPSERPGPSPRPPTAPPPPRGGAPGYMGGAPGYMGVEPG
jgi:hypothetical protein